MSQSLNHCQFIGNLGGDPEYRETNGGTGVANVSLACSWKGKDGKEGAEWVKIVAWGRLAEIVRDYLKKGDKTYFAGRMQTRQWEDKEGNKRYTTEIVAENMIMLGGKGGGQAPRQQAPQRQEPQQSGFDQDDIPF